MIVHAPITGSVWKIECSVGERVDVGDSLVILESMKMEFPVEAEETGTVRTIHCDEGVGVSEGAPLVELE